MSSYDTDFCRQRLRLAQNSLGRTITAFGLCVSFAVTAEAGEWEITPRASVETRLTDNVRNVESGQGKESDLISTAAVGGSVVGQGARAQVSFDFTASRDFFLDETELNSNRENLLGAGNIEAIEDHLFLDARASVSQESIARANQVSAGDRSVQQNQTRVINASVSPTGFFSIGPWANTRGSYSLSEVRFLDTDGGEADVQAPNDTRSNSINLEISSGRYFSRLAWNLSADYLLQEQNRNPQFRRRTLSAGGEYAITRKWSGLAKIGYEDISDQTLVDEIRGPIWSIGARYRPGPRTILRLEFGEQFDRFVWSGDIAYIFDSQTELTASYSVNLENQQQAISQALSALVFDDNGLLVNPFTGLSANPNEPIFDLVNDVGEQEQLSIAFRRDRERNSYSLLTTLTSRAFEVDDSEEVALAVNGSFSRRLTEQTTGSLNASYSQLIKARNGGGDKTLRTNATLSTNFGNNMIGSMSYRFLIRQQDVGTTLTENIVALNLRKQF